MQELLPRAELAASRLKARGATLAVAESSAGGLISAALLAVPGASAYFLGGAVVYTRQARQALLDIPESALAGFRPATEAYALLLARTVRRRFAADFGLAETGATGPTGNRYGDPAGHAWVAVDHGGGETTLVDTSSASALRLETGSADRVANMRAFAAEALDLLILTLA
jgi:nicotinamide-nucleotide amidase